MTGWAGQQVRELALRGLRPVAIAERIGRSGAYVRSVLSIARAEGMEIPKHGTAPMRPVLPRSSEPVLADPVVSAWYDDEIARLAAKGVSQRRIASRFGLSLGYVQRALKRVAA